MMLVLRVKIDELQRYPSVQRELIKFCNVYQTKANNSADLPYYDDKLMNLCKRGL